MKKHTRALCRGAIIAALYVVLTFLASILGLASGAIQIRFSEALCILPCFTAAAVPGLFIGCLIANLLTGCAIWDVVFGSLATLIGAIGARLLHRHPLLAPIPTVLANAIILPPVLKAAYGVADAWWFLVLTVTIGEVISAWLLGILLHKSMQKQKELFK